ncbi:DeoR/GlpR family DNA-binding transcription regulator [Zongyangia hominis]|uniref:DeoR/GlpR transcriptional regulator n=1 Tax=Zongyangia hominis TaxID=2763677 RepID=A0A926E9U2_9FIRM|nr:DeoR/GlpR family DNA-binding transcription regulator [Zongyangia hominis]MBC8569848.1 DeoR/GlpR transcriptional regulator [Zongyangia hominis]
MFSVDREKIIYDYLKEHQTATTAVLSQITGASLATVRRDLNQMHAAGKIRKKYGGAQYLPSAKEQISSGDAEALKERYADKDAIAKVAASLIHDRNIIFLGAGKTCALIARYIRDRQDLTVVTTNIDAVIELSSAKGVKMLLLGGDVNVEDRFIETIGEYTNDMLRKFYFDKVFINIDGVDLVAGYSIVNRMHLPLYSHLLDNSKQFFLTVDKSKFNRRTFVHLCDMDRIRNVIINGSTDPRYIQYYEQSGVNVFLAE